MNGVGLEFNHLFGYGVLDAGAMVALAKKWKTVPPRYHCEAGSTLEKQKVTSDGSILVTIRTDACAGTEYAVNYLEHVQAVISVNATRRGDLELFLTSPMGTRYELFTSFLSILAFFKFQEPTLFSSVFRHVLVSMIINHFQIHDPEPQNKRR